MANEGIKRIMGVRGLIYNMTAMKRPIRTRALESHKGSLVARSFPVICR
jgi:hypothetical protein